MTFLKPDFGRTSVFFSFFKTVDAQNVERDPGIRKKGEPFMQNEDKKGVKTHVR